MKKIKYKGNGMKLPELWTVKASRKAMEKKDKGEGK